MHRLFVTLFLAFLCVPLSAQCDYAALLQDGRALKAKGKYLEALKKYNAARICDQDKSMEVDREVDQLFDAIENERKIALDAKARVEKAKLATEKLRNEAEQERDKAKAAREEAEASEQVALKKTKEAEELRDKAKAARAAQDKYLGIIREISAETVDALTGEANSLIYTTNYGVAGKKLRTAVHFNQLTESFKNAAIEVAFFWNETGQTDAAAGLLEAAREANVPHDQPALRTWLKNYAGARYDSLVLRYYPDMLPLPEGKASINFEKASVSAFEIARTETTLWQYTLYQAAEGKDWHSVPAQPWGYNGDNPVTLVSWFDAAKYANWLSRQFQLDSVYVFKGNALTQINYSAKGYRLPTEVEWEYAARSGPARKWADYAGSDDLDEVGWFEENSGHHTQPVAGKKPNSLGIYDMSGNVSEWCGDRYTADFPSPFPANYHGPDSGVSRTRRGGSWSSDQKAARLQNRESDEPNNRRTDTGFRLVKPL